MRPPPRDFMNDQQKSIEQQVKDLKESNKLGELLLENTDEALFFYSMEGNLIYVNPAFEKITGYTTQELYEKNFIPYVHPDDQEWTTKLWEGLYNGEFFDDVEYRIVKKDGEVRWNSSSWKIVHDSDGRQIGIQGKQQDITERKVTEQRLKEIEQLNHLLLEEAQRKEVEEALRQERDKAQRYLDTVEAIMVALDTNGCITLINRKGCKLLGYEEQELLGKNWFETFLPPEDKESVAQVFQKLMLGNTQLVEYYENPITIRNGDERIIAWHNNILRDDNDKIIGTLGAGEDITKRKRAEEKTQFLLNENCSLTHRLYYSQEKERRHLARELHDQNGQWLTALRMHALLLANHFSGAKPEIRHSIKEIEKIANQMQQSIRQMIRDLKPGDLDEIGLKDSLNELVQRWQELYPQTHCVLRMLGIFDDVNSMLCITIYRIIQESLTNVAKYAEAPNVFIHLRRYTNLKENLDCLLLRIHDDGKGIDIEKPHEGFGLAGMRERVLAARGEFVLDKSSDVGVLIKIRLPVTIIERRKSY